MSKWIMFGDHPDFAARELEKVVSPKNKVTTSKDKLLY